MKKQVGMLLVLSSLVLSGCKIGGNEKVSDVFNAYNCTSKIVNAAKKYNENISLDDVLKQLSKCSEKIDVKKSSNTEMSEIGGTLALYFAFKDILPAKIGARSFQALDFNVDSIEIRNANDSSKSSITYEAMKTLASFGIYDTPRSSAISGSKEIVENKVDTYLSRIHYYMGESYVDDFFATVNHNFLYDNNPYQNAPSDGRLTPDGDKENPKHIYDSNLIPESKIANWILDVQDDIPSVKNFIDSYSDFDARVAGNSAGLVASINKYLAADTAAEFIELLRKQVKEEGYCPLWGTATAGKYSYTNGTRATLLSVEAFTYEADSPSSVAPGSAKYKESVERFGPIFQEALGCTAEQAKTYAEYYSTFKWQLAANQDAWKAPKSGDNYAFLSNDPEKASSNDTYTNAGFEATGETLYDFFKSIGVDQPESVFFSSRRDIESILKIFTDENLNLLKGLVIWQMMYHYSICLPDDEHVTAWLYNPGYGNNKETLIDNKDIFYSKVCSYVSGNISNYYTETTEFANNSAAVVGVVSDIKAAMKKRIAQADWLSSDAVNKANLKVDNMKYVVGGLTSDSSKLEFTPVNYANNASLYDNIGLSEHVSWDAMVPTIGSDWGKASMTELFGSYDPLTANAFYYPGFNAIYITLGFMSCYPNASTADATKLYSDYGWVIAHEISHGFDSSGIYYDQNGTYYDKGWFKAADQSAYDERTKAVANYYDGYEVMPGSATDGKVVLTEAIADINGLHLVMEAANSKSGFDHRQFFINCATNFGTYASRYTYTTQLATDEHPFGRARVNLAMMAMDEWHNAFDTKEGDAMYVAPESRIRIW